METLETRRPPSELSASDDILLAEPSSEPTDETERIRLSISMPADEADSDWTTWLELLALYRQHKFVPHVVSIDDDRLIIDL